MTPFLFAIPERVSPLFTVYVLPSDAGAADDDWVFAGADDADAEPEEVPPR